VTPHSKCQNPAKAQINNAVYHGGLVNSRYSAKKKTLDLRRRYQRTKTDANVRQDRRLQYLEGNRTYLAKLREEKIRSWKEFCTSTDSTNPWNAVYRYAARKQHKKLTLSTLKMSDNT
jgi:hypothetical protein